MDCSVPAPPSESGSTERPRPFRVLAAVSDLFFASKIGAAAKQAGSAVEFFQDASKLETRAAALCSEEATSETDAIRSMVIVDLNDQRFDPIALIQSLKKNPATQGAQILGFISHVQHERKREAEQAGCDLVLPRSVFSQNLYDILRQRSCYT